MKKLLSVVLMLSFLIPQEPCEGTCLSEDETNWFSEHHTLILYAGATYTFIQKNTPEYNNNTNPFLISTKNIYEKPRITPLYDDNIIYQVYNTNTSTSSGNI